jgi:hypothetical protein
LQEIHPDDREGDCGQQELPAEPAAREEELQLLLAPTGDIAAGWSSERRSTRQLGGAVREKTERGPGVHEETRLG